MRSTENVFEPSQMSIDKNLVMDHLYSSSSIFFFLAREETAWMDQTGPNRDGATNVSVVQARDE